jgi:hypothetical protein
LAYDGSSPVAGVYIGFDDTSGTYSEDGYGCTGESIKIVPGTASAYELSLREDRRKKIKPGNSDAGPMINVEIMMNQNRM